VRGDLDTTLCHGHATGRWFSSGALVSSTNKTDRHDITEILLKVALNTINLTPSISMEVFFFRNKLHEKKIYYLDMNMIDTEKYQHARQNMKFTTRSLHSLANKLHILARQADIFGINQFTSR
jgi:hypothetical protein